MKSLRSINKWQVTLLLLVSYLLIAPFACSGQTSDSASFSRQEIAEINKTFRLYAGCQVVRDSLFGIIGRKDIIIEDQAFMLKYTNETHRIQMGEEKRINQKLKRQVIWSYIKGGVVGIVIGAAATAALR